MNIKSDIYDTNSFKNYLGSIFVLFSLVVFFGIVMSVLFNTYHATPIAGTLPSSEQGTILGKAFDQKDFAAFITSDKHSNVYFVLGDERYVMSVEDAKKAGITFFKGSGETKSEIKEFGALSKVLEFLELISPHGSPMFIYTGWFFVTLIIMIVITGGALVYIFVMVPSTQEE